MNKAKSLLRLFGENVDPKGAKMLLAALASLAVYYALIQFLPMRYPMFILNTVFIVTSLNLALTKKASVERIIGTAASIALGLICYFLSGGSIYVAPVGLTVAVFLSYLFFRHIVNVLVLCTCMLMFNTSGGHPFEYATARVVNTVIGLLIAVAVAALYTHPYSRAPVYRDYRKKIAEVAALVKQYEAPETNPPPAVLLAKISDISLLESKMTRDTGILSADFRQKIIRLSQNLNQALCRLGTMQELPPEHTEAITRERKKIDDLLAESTALLAELSGDAAPKK